MKSSFPATPEQSHILSLAKDTSANVMVRSYAGTGKTSTLELIERHVSTKPILYLVFNKRNAEEAEKRMLSTTTVRTFNSLGHRIWAKANASRLTVNPRKTADILRSLIDEVPKPDQGALWDVFWDVVHGVALAKALGYVPEGKFPTANRLLPQGAFHAALDESPDDLVADLIEAVLTRSIAAAYKGSIDFNDQVYMPALFGGTFPHFPLVKVDEYQDLNPVNHAMLDKLGRSRIIGVGDPCQNIYGFRGAKQGGMAAAEERFKMTVAELTVSFRCPEAIVRNVHWHVPQFKWTKPGGSVNVLTSLDPYGIVDGATILCRNNAPLFRCALGLLSVGRSVRVAGSDIGPRLTSTMAKLGDEGMARPSVLSAIADWLAEKLAKNSASAHDMAACMRVFAEQGETLGQAVAYAKHVLSQEGSIRLMTGHKSKGLEWDTVYVLDEHLCRPDEQDQNLRYVMATRSKDQLFYINSDQIEWPAR